MRQEIEAKDKRQKTNLGYARPQKRAHQELVPLELRLDDDEPEARLGVGD
jgi:hypothetical protein